MQKIDYKDLALTEDYLYLYQEQPFTGIATEEYKGFLLSETHFVDGSQEGVARRWYPLTKQLFSEIDYLNNTVHGLNKHWYESGKLKSESRVEFGITLEKRTWSEEGELIEAFTLDQQDPLYRVWELRSKS